MQMIVRNMLSATMLIVLLHCNTLTSWVRLAHRYGKSLAMLKYFTSNFIGKIIEVLVMLYWNNYHMTLRSLYKKAIYKRDHGICPQDDIIRFYERMTREDRLIDSFTYWTDVQRRISFIHNFNCTITVR